MLEVANAFLPSRWEEQKLESVQVFCLGCCPHRSVGVCLLSRNEFWKLPRPSLLPRSRSFEPGYVLESLISLRPLFSFSFLYMQNQQSGSAMDTKKEPSSGLFFVSVLPASMGSFHQSRQVTECGPVTDIIPTFQIPSGSTICQPGQLTKTQSSSPIYQANFNCTAGTNIKYLSFLGPQSVPAVHSWSLPEFCPI